MSYRELSSASLSSRRIWLWIAYSSTFLHLLRAMVRLRPLLVLALFLLPIVAPVMPAHAATIPLSELDQAINLGISVVYDSVRPVDSSYIYYVMPDHPSPTISVEYDGKVYVPGSFFDPGDRQYKTELVSVTYNSVSWRYYFNVDKDDDYDIVIYAQLTNINYYTDRLYIFVDKAEYNFNIIIGTYYPYKYYNVGQGWSTTIDIYGWSRYRFLSARYVARHSTRIAAWLLEDAGYTTIASRLHNLMDSCDYTYDVYAPVFGRDVNYPDDFFTKPETWLGKGYSCLPWSTGIFINYPYKSRMYIFKAFSDYTYHAALRAWEEAPLSKLLKAMHLLNKYGAAKASKAEQLIAEAITEGGWDGYGIKHAEIDLGYVATGYHLGVEYPYNYAGYPVYLNAVLLAALVKYYQVTGDRWIAGNDILYMADRLAGILVKLQWKYEHKTPWGYVRLVLFRGWWPAAYDVGSLISKSSAWGIIDTLTHTADNVAGILAKARVDFPSEALRPMPSEFPFAIVNSESTILAIQALKLYRQLGREPIDPISDVIAGFDGVFVEGGGGGYAIGDSHGGETSDDGRWIVASALVPGLGGDAWHYQYAKFKFSLEGGGYYKLRIASMVSYSGKDSYGSSAYVYLVVKLLDAYGNVVAQVEKLVDHVNENTLFNKAKAVTIEFDTGYISGGTYYVEIGIKVVADNSPISWEGVWINGKVVIDEIVLAES